MPGYCEITDIQALYSVYDLAVLTGDPTGVTVNESLLQQFIDDASAEMNLILSKRYNVPLDNYVAIPPVIALYCRDIAIFRMYENYYHNSEVPSVQVWRRVNALSELKKISTGERELDFNTDAALKNLNVESIEFPQKRITNKLDEYYNGLQ